MDKFYFGTNTKMYKTRKQTADFVKQLYDLTLDLDPQETELFVIPSFTALDTAARAAGGRIRIGAQNMGWEEQGPFTGEISPLMIEETGASMVMAGHSERRHGLRETDAEENKKVLCALQHRMKALLCIGETKEEKEQGIAREVLAIQLKKGFAGVKKEQLGEIWAAYEPVWAIGEGGTPATAEYAAERHREIRLILKEMFGEPACKIPILYGGSVHLENAVELSKIPDADGLFIGRSAWDAQNFNRIIRAVLKQRRCVERLSGSVCK